jgi:Holliday junction resolvase RusA-like endonuclease
MIRLLGIRLPLEPVAAARARSGQGRTYTPKTYRRWKDSAVDMLRRTWAGRPRLELPVVFGLSAVAPRPARPPRTYTVRGVDLDYPFPWLDGRNPSVMQGDLDNLEKAALDALVQAGILLDDRLVHRHHHPEKVYAAVGEKPCVEVQLWSLLVPVEVDTPHGRALRAPLPPSRGAATG